MTLSPREKKFDTDASIAPVPEATSDSTSFCGAENFFQIGEHGRVNLAEIFRAVMYVRPHHGVQRLGIKRGRTGC